MGRGRSGNANVLSAILTMNSEATNSFINQLGILSESPLFFIWVGVVAILSFIFIYFLFTYPVFRHLEKKSSYLADWKSNPQRVIQIKREITHSLISIILFGLYGSLTWILHKYEIVHIEFKFQIVRFLTEVVVLFFWNEFHFFVVHRFLHIRWFYKNVHYIHHMSDPPTPFAVFGLHWFESVLLGSVMITVMFFHNFLLWSLLMLPVFSLALNTIAHSNLERVYSKSNSLLIKIATRHGDHHRYYEKNYGFALPIFDWLYELIFRANGERNA